MGDKATKPRRSFLYSGCLAGLVLMLMVVLGGLFGLHYARKMFNDFTDDKPMAMPPIKLTPAEIDQLEQRIETFRQAVRNSKPTEPLVLTSDEINALLATDPDFSALKGKLYVTMSSDRVKGQLSVPMDSVGLPLFKGRYLNGTGMFEISLRNNRVRLTTMSFQVKGRAVPEVYMEQIRKHNLAEGINSDPRAAAALERLKDIKVQDGKLVVTPK
jgi:hypothetical protein